MDTLVSLGLVSHFGRIQNSNAIVIHPVSLKKGSTIINIWGFGSLKDERLNAMIQVSFHHCAECILRMFQVNIWF